MRKIILAGAAVLALAGPALAEDKAPSMPPLPPEGPSAATPPAPKYDLSRPVTLTGYEVQALMRFASAQATAQAAEAAAAGANEKLGRALTLPAEPQPSK